MSKDEKTPPTAGTARGPALHLVYSGEEILVPPEAFALGDQPLPIGREVTGVVTLESDRRASRLHATLRPNGRGGFVLTDARSSNGTFVNGGRVVEAALEDGDVIATGDSLSVVRFEADPGEDGEVPTLLGVSAGMRALRAGIRAAGRADTPVLLVGERGSGKETVARALHAARRANEPFITLDCTAIPEALVEQQLFGLHALDTGDACERPGAFGAAQGGTLVLEEVSALPLAAQKKLLLAIEERRVLPVGATTSVPCDLRIVAVTHHDLAWDVAVQRFRSDLFERLSASTLQIPPLRERREDILLLCTRALGMGAQRLSPALAQALLLHDYPFNVRELFGLCARLLVRGAGAPLLELALIQDWLGDADEPTPVPYSRAPMLDG